MGIVLFFNHVLVLSGIWAILAMSLNLALGYTGLRNIGHIAFFGVGAYASALLHEAGFPFYLSFVGAMVAAGALGFVVSLPTAKLKGDYLAIATLGLIFIVENTLRNWVSFTRGPFGIPGIGKPEFFGLTVDNSMYLGLVLIVGVGVFLLLRYLARSPFGRALQAIRDDELVAASLGKNVQRYRMQVLVISGAIAGAAGSLFAHYISFIDPSLVTIPEAVLLIAMVIFGGVGSLWGSVIGATVLTFLPELISLLPVLSDSKGALEQILFALVLLVLLLRRPQGLFGGAHATG